MDTKILHVGIDVGSTTTKIVVIDKEKSIQNFSNRKEESQIRKNARMQEEILYSNYERHNADQVKSVYLALKKLKDKFKDAAVEVHLALTGSGSKILSELLGISYVQEVVANSIALRRQYKEVGTAIELGGQDAKIIFFGKDEKTGDLNVADMRMNGSCAGGTGAFIDEVASILRVPIEQFNELAKKGDSVYDISGRCGVYAKTDIQPLLNQGVSKENLALSTFHAIAKQTIGGLAQGLDIKNPVAFEGGPLTFNPRLIQVFCERLHLEKEDVILPEHPEIMVAYGAALSLSEMYEKDDTRIDIDELMEKLQDDSIKHRASENGKGKLYFESEKEKKRFLETHALPKWQPKNLVKGEKVRAYLGIDCGSTTTKFVLMDEQENILDSFYASNEGEPLKIAKEALLAMYRRYKEAGVELEIIAVGTTGYGEMLFAKAFSAECHVVETVAHAKAANKYVPDASFILDIGGQDMKAIWLENGIITNIVVNEACSSGCGSFLENFASSLHIPVKEIAKAAFESENPAVLGSRCTVFMNSSIVTEQRNGKLPEDIMAGLCRSIIENVFTKVIRISNLKTLGDKIVVQGGTFQNDAVLRALEQYIGKEVTRAPYPGIMGAIGAALITKERVEEKMKKDGKFEKTFLGLEKMDTFSYTQQSNSICPFCTNHCKRTIVTFSNGNSWVTNNRCERGEIIGNPKDQAVREKVKQKTKKKDAIPNLYKIREELLFRQYPCKQLLDSQNTVIGIPRVLSFWDNMPFWQTFFTSLGFEVKISDESSRKMYENGLSAVTSDTVCFPAKLVHGHIRNLIEKKVDRIFMPSITVIKSENQEKTSESMCAIVKGYPIVIRNSDNPKKRWDVPFDAPLFHWYTDKDREEQLTQYMKETFGISKKIVLQAIAVGDKAQRAFKRQLKKEGKKIIDIVKREGKYAVILASRPYQNDALVNHDLPDIFLSMGIPVLTADSVPGIEEIDLGGSTLDIVNNYHARMLSSAIMAAQTEYLEYVQIVSFGCGHDAYLSDEIIRLMKETSGKTPLILKLDESDIKGPLQIRVRSFIETLSMRKKQGNVLKVHELEDPYKVKFTKQDVKERVVLVPNTSHAFSRIMSAAMEAQHLKTIPLEIGREEAIRLGKEYVHNDICFPAQIVIGEALAALKSGKYDPDYTAIAMGKYVGDCRLTHYGKLLRKALDDAGFSQVPILTNDDIDIHNMHPGFKMNLASSIRIAFALPMIDVMEELLRKIRPYELKKGAANKAFEKGMDYIVEGLAKNGVTGAKKGFQRAIRLMKKIPYDKTNLRPTVLIVGEYLLNFHPGANHDIEEYLERNGFEIIEARMTDVIQKTYFYKASQNKEYHLHKPIREKAWYSATNVFFNMAHDLTDKIAKEHPLYEPACRMEDLVKDSDSIIHHTFDTGEGVLIPAEIIHHAKHGCKAFVILQPFGCLPNHVVGRGIAKRLKEMYPDVQILPLDYDPDVSFANIENRLQMLIMNAKK